MPTRTSALPPVSHFQMKDGSRGDCGGLAMEVATMERMFPGRLFFSVIFRQHPVARLAPEPLKSQNVFVVSKDGGVEHLTSSKELEKFFRARRDRYYRR